MQMRGGNAKKKYEGRFLVKLFYTALERGKVPGCIYIPDEQKKKKEQPGMRPCLFHCPLSATQPCAVLTTACCCCHRAT